ncbi:multidrug resistance efflux pump [Roseimicrobium gellanilyticum]|uniref:Multidrug resistance efflux pump n=1 Tax=Roseimicrobium gellanilyticum TaxID=748857 RepID=A0A366H7M4_9BACT|nr:biotin/lipoyl-binding protein [Roseimicrobium gellanilyticum]RBP38056.1 multidrug resistance efflux pump [Roseimicrobium gellanilyticum]
MELILLIIYSIIVWLIFFKFKLLPWNITSQVIVVTIPIFALTVLILFMNIVAPSSHDVRAMNYVIPIVPRVTGQVTEVPIEPNRPIKKGDVLFKIDPVPFEQAVKAAEAKLAELKVGLITAQAYQRGLDDELKNAQAATAALNARLDLSKKRVEQYTVLAASGAGKRAEQEQAETDVANLQSQISGSKAIESKIKQKIDARTEAGEIDEVAQAKAQIAKAEADLIAARYDLDGTTHLAPANGRVTNLALQPGVRASTVTANAVMSFIQEDDPWVLAFYHQNELRYVQPGDEAEIFLQSYPDRIIKCKVDSIMWATAQGQMPISGFLGTTSGLRYLDDRIAVRLLVEPKDKELFLAAGAVGAGAIYTEKGKMIHIVRKVFVRVSTKLDWFVFKLH